MIDLFTPQKTVSDILQDNVANTVAAKIQNNHIDNIKTVVESTINSPLSMIFLKVKYQNTTKQLTG